MQEINRKIVKKVYIINKCKIDNTTIGALEKQIEQYKRNNSRENKEISRAASALKTK